MFPLRYILRQDKFDFNSGLSTTNNISSQSYYIDLCMQVPSMCTYST